MPIEYFEARERALLGPRYETLYAPPAAEAARGVTVSALRMTPEAFAAGVDFAVEPSPFCRAGFLVRQPDLRPGRHPWHHAGVFYSQEPSASSAALKREEMRLKNSQELSPVTGMKASTMSERRVFMENIMER